MGGRGHEKRKRPGCEEQNRDGAAYDGDQLVHLPGGLPLPDAWHLCVTGRGRHPDWLLLVGHHLQVWRRPLDLPDFVRQVEQDFGRQLWLQGGSAWLSSSAGRCRLPADFSSCGVALTAVGQRDL